MSLLNLKKSFDRKGIIFSYSGNISQSIISCIAETVENKFPKNIFAIFIEQIQNIMNYSYDGYGIVIIGYIEEKYFISSANIIDLKNEKKIITKIDKINMLSRVELKSYYRELRRDGKEKHNHGAGLGFLEMAKKSSEQLEYNISKIDAERSFFEIKVII